jgi:hypothetical protein
VANDKTLAEAEEGEEHNLHASAISITHGPRRLTPNAQHSSCVASHFTNSRHIDRVAAQSRVERVLVAHARGIVRREMPPRRIPHVTRIPH